MLRSNAAVGLIGLVLIAILCAIGFRKDIPFLNEPYPIKAAFRDGSGMKPGSPVRIAGVEVGRVTKVEHTSPGSRSVTATLALKKGRPVHADATAKIRPRIFLEGNFYVDLQPGTPAAPELGRNGVIPVSRTANPVQIGEVLSMLKSDTRQDLRNTLHNLGSAEEAGFGRAFNAALTNQGEANRYTAIVNEALLGRNPEDLATWIREAGVVAGALDRSPEQLQSLVQDFNLTAAALADREQDLRLAVHELPGTFREALPTFAALNRSFPGLRRFARESLPAVRSSGPALSASVPLVVQLRGLVSRRELRGVTRNLRRATPYATQLAKASVPLLQQLRELSSCTSNVLVPWGNDKVTDKAFPPSGPVHEEIAKVLPNLAGESRSFDANGEFFHILGGGGAETVDLGNNLFGVAAAPVEGVNPPPVRTRPPLRPDQPCENQELPDLNSIPGEPPRAVSNPANSAKARERSERARALAIAVLQAKLRAEGKNWRVLDKDATLDEIKAYARQNGNLDQLQLMAKRALDMPGSARR